MSKYALIFGCGYYGRAIFRKIKSKKIIFIDNFFKKKIFLGAKVYKPNEILKRKIPYSKILLAGRYINEQLSQLKELKLDKNIKIFKNYEVRATEKRLLERNKLILSILAELTIELNNNKIFYWYDRSSLLAIKRGQILSELSDVDISIDINDYHKLQKIMKSLSKKFFIKKKLMFYNKKKINKYFISSSHKNIKKSEPALVDFIYRKIDKNYIYSIGIKLKKISKKLIEPRSLLNYNGMKIYLPNKSDMYLKTIYGKNWKKISKFYLISSRI